MFGLRKLLGMEKVVVIGLCHACFKSGVELSSVHKILCKDCVPADNM